MKHLSGLQLDALRLGQGTPDALAHLEKCEHCSHKQEELTAAAAKWAQEFSPNILASDALQRAEKNSKTAPWWQGAAPWWQGAAPSMWPALAAVAAVMVLFFVVPRGAEDTRIKGARDAIELYTVTEGEPIRARGPVAPNSVLRLRFNPGDKPNVKIYWSDTLLYQGRATKAGWVPNNIELDASTETEKITAEFCDDSGDCSVETLEVHKAP